MGSVGGASEGTRSGLVSLSPSSPQDGGCAFDSGGGEDFKGGAALSNGLDRPFNALLKLLAELSPQMGM